MNPKDPFPSDSQPDREERSQISKERADVIAARILEKARNENLESMHTKINWYLLTPYLAAGIFACIHGAIKGSVVYMVAGIGMCFAGGYFGITPIGRFWDLLTKMSSQPSPPTRILTRFLSGVLERMLIRVFIVVLVLALFRVLELKGLGPFGN
jgi:hypothetical protein